MWFSDGTFSDPRPIIGPPEVGTVFYIPIGGLLVPSGYYVVVGAGDRTMPFKPKDALKHTKKAKSKTAKRQFAKVANSMLARGESEGSAIRAANAAVAKRKRGKK